MSLLLLLRLKGETSVTPPVVIGGHYGGPAQTHIPRPHKNWSEEKEKVTVTEYLPPPSKPKTVSTEKQSERLQDLNTIALKLAELSAKMEGLKNEKEREERQTQRLLEMQMLGGLIDKLKADRAALLAKYMMDDEVLIMALVESGEL